jgi:hypothetical protein
MANTVIVNVEANTASATANITSTTVAVDNLTKAEQKLNRESEKVASGFEDVTKNGGAIAILDQLTGGLASRVRDSAEATKLFNFNLKGMRTALIATGIGAFIVALGVVVAYWDEITDFITGASAALKEQRLEYEKIGTRLDASIGLLEQEKSLLEASGKSTVEITNELRKQLLLRQENNILQLESLQTELEKEKAQNKELTYWEQIKSAVLFTFNKKAGLKSLAEGLNEDTEESLELETQITAIKSKQLEIGKKLQVLDTEEIKTQKEKLEAFQKIEEELRLGAINTQKEIRDEELLQSKLKYEELINQAVAFYGVLSEEVAELETTKQEVKTALTLKHAEEDRATQKTIDDQKDADKKIADQLKIDGDQFVADATASIRQAEFDNAANALGLLASLFPKSRALQAASIIATNAAGIARIVQQTAASNAAATAQGAALAIPTAGASVTTAAALVAGNKISAGISIAASVAATAKGLAALKSGGSASGSSSTGGNTPTPVQIPSFNIVGQGAGSQIASAIGEQQQTPVQAFVVSQDVTTAQSLENGIIQGATLGG